MNQTQLDKYKETALEFVNQIRQAFKQKPLTRLPKGLPGEGEQCVLARALPTSDSVSQDSIEFGNEVKAYIAATAVGQRVDLENPTDSIVPPKAVAKFITAFDDNLYPELETRKAERVGNDDFGYSYL